MKSCLIVIAIAASIGANAQNRISMNHSIDDDGKHLTIKIKGTINDKPVDYNKTFDVSGMNEEQKNEIKRHIYDSLGLPEPVAPRAPIKPRAPIEARVPAAPAEPSVPPIPAAPALAVIAARSEFSETYAIGGDHPFTKEINYNPKTGILHMKYRFIKNGEETTVEKFVDAKDKSKEEKDLIIKKYEKEIGLLQPEII